MFVLVFYTNGIRWRVCVFDFFFFEAFVLFGIYFGLVREFYVGVLRFFSFRCFLLFLFESFWCVYSRISLGFAFVFF